MLEKKPVESEDLVVKWTEFVAEFRELPELESHARHLNFVQLMSLDILVPLLLALIVVLLLLYKLLRMLAKKCFASSKLKDD
jgi:hypothetical protein